MNKFNKFINILESPFYLLALINGAAAGVEHIIVLNSLVCESVVDVGANRGQFSLVARKYFPKAMIFAFEPLKEARKIYQRVFASDQFTKLYEFAIGSKETESIIHVSKADDSSSLLPISALQNELYPGTSEKETRSIFVKPLNAILSPADIKGPALLKIDVQGYEKQVLEGCKSLLSLFSFVYVECSFIELYIGQALAYEIISFLSNYGFILSGVYNLDNDKNGIAVQGDFLFTKE